MKTCYFLIEIEFLLYIKKARLNNGTYLFGRFLRQELFASNNQFLIYFREAHLDENNIFTLDISDHEFVQ